MSNNIRFDFIIFHWKLNKILIYLAVQLAVAVEYADCTSAVDNPSHNECPDMTLNCMCFNSGALRNVEYSFMAITPRSTLNRSGNICLGHIYGSKRTV